MASLKWIDPLTFIKDNDIRNENGSPIEFTDHYFLVDPYLDRSPLQAIIKCSQIGWSTLAVNKAIWLAKHESANVIYTLPSKSAVKDFVTPKVDPIIKHNEAYKSLVGSTESVALKSIGDRFIYFRGSWEESAAISISAHVLINDEVDRSNQKVLRTYKTRLDDAKRERPDLGFVWQFSNPSIPGFGVDEAWQNSDQKHWFVKCPHCGYEWYLKWPESINMQTQQYICTQCHGVLSDNDRRYGRWVAKHSGRAVSGYWISQLMAPWIPASKIIEDSKGDQQVFYNFTLGLPYISADQSVSRKTITDLISPDTNSMSNVAMGVDNGVVKTVVIGNINGIFKIYETESWEEIESDIRRYKATCVIDANPYPATPIKLAQKYPGNVFIHYFVQNKKDTNIITWGEGDKQRVVESDRTKIIDMLVAEFVSKDIIFNLRLDQLEQYIYDWTQLYRTTRTSAQGIVVPVWETIEGRRDHYAFASIYWRIALEKTYAMGGVLRVPQKRSTMGKGVYVDADQTVPAIDLEELAKKAQHRKSWKTR